MKWNLIIIWVSIICFSWLTIKSKNEKYLFVPVSKVNTSKNDIPVECSPCTCGDFLPPLPPQVTNVDNRGFVGLNLDFLPPQTFCLATSYIDNLALGNTLKIVVAKALTPTASFTFQNDMSIYQFYNNVTVLADPISFSFPYDKIIHAKF